MEKIKTDNLRLAKVKYFDTKHNGAEISDIEAYAFLVEVGENQYLNVFDPDENIAVFDRSNYSNYTKDDVAFGNRLVHVCGEIANGACYVMERISVPALLGVESITLEQLKDYILASDKFFVDRLSLLESGPRKRGIAHKAKVWDDTKKMMALKKYIASHEDAVQYKKDIKRNS